jgi:hypothetical protein
LARYCPKGWLAGEHPGCYGKNCSGKTAKKRLKAILLKFLCQEFNEVFSARENFRDFFTRDE